MLEAKPPAAEEGADGQDRRVFVKAFFLGLFLVGHFVAVYPCKTTLLFMFAKYSNFSHVFLRK